MSSAIDLSRLPPPTVVEPLSYEEILAAWVADLQARDPAFTALTDSDPAMKVLQVGAYREMLFRQRVNDAARSVMVAYAAGANLDQLGAIMGVTRFLLTEADPVAGTPAVYESDDDFRRRIVLAPEALSVAGPEAAYVFHALSAHSDVRDASAISPAPGEVLVTVLSHTGAGVPAAPVLAAVTARVSADNVRPLTDDVTVQAATVVDYQVQATLFTFTGPDPSVVIAEAQKRVEALVDESRRLGRDVNRSAFFAALHVPGVQRVDLIQPAADQVLDRTQAAHCTGIALTHGGLDD